MTSMLKRLFTAFLILGSAVIASAQQQPQMPPIPTDPNVRIGKLENGLTYYIRHNELPEDRADFYIAQKGSSTISCAATPLTTLANTSEQRNTFHSID